MPGASSLLAIQTAVYALLIGDATLAALVGGAANILNFEPEEPLAKFIVVGNATEQSWHTLGGTGAGWGWDATLTVHCYSYYKGDIEVLQLLDRVTTLLNKPEGIVVAGYGTAICEYGEKLTRVLIETKDKQERRHIPALISLKVHD